MENDRLYAQIRRLKKENAKLRSEKETAVGLASFWKTCSFRRAETIVELNSQIAGLKRDCNEMKKESDASMAFAKQFANLNDELIALCKELHGTIEDMNDVIFNLGDELIDQTAEMCYFDALRATVEEYEDYMKERGVCGLL